MPLLEITPRTTVAEVMAAIGSSGTTTKAVVATPTKAVVATPTKAVVTTTTKAPLTTTMAKALATTTVASLTAMPAGYMKHTGIDPNVENGPGTAMYGPDAFYVRRNEKGHTLPAPGATATSGGANGWTVVIMNPEGTPEGQKVFFKTKVSSHISTEAWDGSPGPFDAMKFTPTLAPLDGNHTYEFFFAPTATSGGGRRSRGSKRGRKGRKGTRRH
jgi:hypothetical protein